jgi:hypothetical protein
MVATRWFVGALALAFLLLLPDSVHAQRRAMRRHDDDRVDHHQIIFLHRQIAQVRANLAAANAAQAQYFYYTGTFDPNLAAIIQSYANTLFQLQQQLLAIIHSH